MGFEDNVHVVEEDDSTTEIAFRYGVSNQELVDANPDKPYHIDQGQAVFDELLVGEELLLP